MHVCVRRRATFSPRACVARMERSEIRDVGVCPDLLSSSGLQHRQATRLRPAGKCPFKRSDFVVIQREIARRGIVGGVFRRPSFWNRKQ